MRIRREDVDHVREHTRVEEIVSEYVTLKPAGVGSQKGLCPFHEERTPSFNVRPQAGLWHCFGCDKGGDVIDFVQEIDHLTFTEAVERLAARLGYPLRYEDEATGRGPSRRDQVGQRQRLVEANRTAAQFFAEQLFAAGDALAGRQFLSARGFDREAAAHFGVGFAPRSGEALLRHLRGRGFTEDELVTSGLAGRGQRGLYDRFRGRLVWPIRDVTGDVVGFGARRLFDDDRIEAKYLNTPETVIYKKSQVLYGVDLAKKEIARRHQVVVVEGYTDVMACHLSGVETAVATCGTAFGGDHIRIVRRLLGDDGTLGGEVVFTFDGDEAGQKAAMRAFEDDQRFVAQTYVAVAADRMDPCELRQARGEAAVRALISGKQPLFEFAIRTTLRRFDLDTVEGRVQALRMAAPMVARIRAADMRPEYARELAGWLGMEIDPVARAVAVAARQGAGRGVSTAPGSTAGRGTPSGSGAAAGPGSAPVRGPASGSGWAPGSAGGGGSGRPAGSGAAAGWGVAAGSGLTAGSGATNGSGGAPAGSGAASLGAAGGPGERRGPREGFDPRDPVARMEREALQCLLQVPGLVPAEDADGLGESAFEVPAFRAVHHAVRAAGGMATAAGLAPVAWVAAVRAAAPDVVAGLVTELAVAPLPVHTDEALGRYAQAMVLRVADLELTRQIGTLRSRVQRLDPDDPGYLEAVRTLFEAEAARRALRERISGT